MALNDEMEKLRSEARERALAVVTGASAGLGAVFAQRLAQAGYDVLLIARRKERLESLCAELRHKYGVAAEAFAADLAKEEDLARVEEHLRQAGNLEFLVNNAGFGTRSLFHEADVKSQEAMHRLHVMATMRLCGAALPGMVARNSGFIVNVSSVAAFMAGPYNVSYCATKAWMNNFSVGLALEMRALGAGVQIQALCPGFTKTEFHESMGISRDFAPRSWWMTAEDVVDASLAGLKRNKLVVVPGWRYKLVVAALKIIPSSLLRALASRAPNVRRGAQKPEAN